MNNTQKELNNFVDYLIENYSEFDTSVESNILDVHELPESEREELSALILANDKDYVCDTLSRDNPKFEKFVIPSLFRYLKNPHESDNRYDFLEQLRESITDYHSKAAQNIIDERLEVYNLDREPEPLSYNDTWGISHVLP